MWHQMGLYAYKSNASLKDHHLYNINTVLKNTTFLTFLEKKWYNTCVLVVCVKPCFILERNNLNIHNTFTLNHHKFLISVKLFVV